MSSSGTGERRSAPAEQHLGDRLAAFVDGELTDDTRDRVLAHLATCPQCKAAASEQRRLKSVVAASELPAISAGLLARLQGLPGMGGDGDDGGSPGDGESRAGSTEAGARTGRGPAASTDAGTSSGEGRRPYDDGLLGTGAFGTGRRGEFSYLSPARDLVAPAGSHARGFRVHELAEAAAADHRAGQDAGQTAGHPVGAGPASASRGRRFAFAAAGAFSMAAIAIGGALPMEAVSDGGTRPDEGPAVSPFSANSVSTLSDPHGIVPRGVPWAEPTAAPGPTGDGPLPGMPDMASATSVSLTRPLLAPGAVPAVSPTGAAGSSFVLH